MSYSYMKKVIQFYSPNPGWSRST